MAARSFSMHYHVNVIHGGDVFKSHGKGTKQEADNLYNSLLNKAVKQQYTIQMIGTLAKVTNSEKNISVTVVNTRCHFKCT